MRLQTGTAQWHLGKGHEIVLSNTFTNALKRTHEHRRHLHIKPATASQVSPASGPWQLGAHLLPASGGLVVAQTSRQIKDGCRASRPHPTACGVDRRLDEPQGGRALGQTWSLLRQQPPDVPHPKYVPLCFAGARYVAGSASRCARVYGSGCQSILDSAAKQSASTTSEGRADPSQDEPGRGPGSVHPAVGGANTRGWDPATRHSRFALRPTHDGLFRPSLWQNGYWQ